jgi:hypothetical protein
LSHLWAGLEEDKKADWAKIDADLANAKMIAIKEMTERSEAERKPTTRK